jgi:hypothetical protein
MVTVVIHELVTSIINETLFKRELHSAIHNNPANLLKFPMFFMDMDELITE